MRSKAWILRARAVRDAATATAALAFLSACTVGPDFKRPAPLAARHHDEQAERQFAGSGGPAGSQHFDPARKIDGDWWSTLGSATLDQVMRQAIHGNLDLAAADATIAQANEAVAAARGGLRPQVDFGAAAGRSWAADGAVVETSNFYSVGPQVSFDFDVFGGGKRLIEERAALAEFHRHRFDAAYLTLTGDVASQAVLLASARAQIDAIQVLLAEDRETLEIVRTGRRHGDTTEVDVAQATAQLAEDETLAPPLEQQRDTARHALSVLAGKSPAGWAAPDFDLSDFALPVDLPVTLPSEVARDRPDILEAEARLHAASAAVGVATADLYPRLQLSGSLAGAGPGIGALWSLAAGLAGPIYHGGALKAHRRAAVDGYKASLAGYRQTVVSSLGQVADVLQAIHHDAEEYAAQQRALNAAETSLRLNRGGYQAGEIATLQVLDAARAYQRALLGQIRSRTAQYLDAVQLSVALGGNASGAFDRKIASRREP
jgi:NodT family efflux transporter outer membrane factor (OMF) lipoprotein